MNSDETQETMQEQELEAAGDDVTRLVPVTESIRYRRRAQSAEKKTQDLAEQLADANQRIAQMSADLAALELDRKLTRKLTVAGVTDLEAGALIAKARMEGRADGDLDACIEQLRKEKSYLFGSSDPGVVSRKTAGAKDRAVPRQTALERAAQRAARTRNRADLQEYLKLRRNVL
jgi:TolA-binding protein